MTNRLLAVVLHHRNWYGCMSIPTVGKLQLRWEGKWKVVQMKSPVTVKITDGRRTRVVHINRVRHRNQPVETPEFTTNDPGPRQWHPMQTEHFILQEISDVILHATDILQFGLGRNSLGQASARRGVCNETN